MEHSSHEKNDITDNSTNFRCDIFKIGKLLSRIYQKFFYNYFQSNNYSQRFSTRGEGGIGFSRNESRKLVYAD